MILTIREEGIFKGGERQGKERRNDEIKISPLIFLKEEIK
jgi:hypothetical protein